MTDRFVAIDFETANSDLASICQVGAVTFENGHAVELWGTLVNPEDYFDRINVDIHGIDERMVKDAPTFPHIYETLAGRLRESIVVSHTSFDRTSLAQALWKHGLPQFGCNWLDSAGVVRRTWTHWAHKGYGLGNVCNALGIQFKAHDAIEDARAAGEVLLLAISKAGLDLDSVMSRVKQPINLQSAVPIAMEGDPNGPLAGEEIVFTGTLTLPRRDAASLAARAGCDVGAGVSKTTTLLVVGDQDIERLAGHEKSTKHRKAEVLIAKGQVIRILKESDFIRLLDIAS
jgi:DNA polymerase-3 subunit epsilon